MVQPANMSRSIIPAGQKSYVLQTDSPIRQPKPIKGDYPAFQFGSTGTTLEQKIAREMDIVNDICESEVDSEAS